MTFRDRLLNWSFVASVLINCAFAIWIGKSDIFQSHTSKEEIMHMMPVHITHPPIKQKPKPKPPPPKKIIPPKVVPRIQTPQRPQPIVRPAVHITVNTGTHTSAPTSNAVYVPSSPPEQTTTAPPDTVQPTPPPPVVAPPPPPPVVVAPPPPPPVVHHDPPPPPAIPDRFEPAVIGDWGNVTIPGDFDQSTLTSTEIVIGFTVSASGHPEHIRVTKSSGNSELDNQCIDLIQQHSYKPVVHNGVAQTTSFEHTFTVGN